MEIKLLNSSDDLTLSRDTNNKVKVYDSIKTIIQNIEDFQKKPDVLYETDGTSGLLGLNESSYGSNNYQLENMDFTPYRSLKCYIKASNGTVAETASTPSLIIEIPLDDAAKNTNGNYYLGAQEVLYPFNRNRHFACGVAVDGTKTKLKFVYEVTLWDVTTSAANSASDGRYLYKIEGCY